MYKVRDEVDLKELEKFGFKKEENRYEKKLHKSSPMTWVFLYIDKERNICICDQSILNYSSYKAQFNVGLYIKDLIQANIVEEVEDR